MADLPSFRDHRVNLAPLLRVLHRHGSVPPSAIYDEVAGRAGVTAEQRAVDGAGDRSNPVYRNRIQFARQSLVDCGLMIAPSDPRWQRGVGEISAEGAALAERVSDDVELEAELRQRDADNRRERARE